MQITTPPIALDLDPATEDETRPDVSTATATTNGYEPAGDLVPTDEEPASSDLAAAEMPDVEADAVSAAAAETVIAPEPEALVVSPKAPIEPDAPSEDRVPDDVPAGPVEALSDQGDAESAVGVNERPSETDVPNETTASEPVSPPQQPDAAGVTPGHVPAAPDPIDHPATAWGHVDADGNLWQRDGELHTGRVVGRITGANPAIAFGFYAQQFDQFVRRVDALAAEIAEATNKAPFLPRVQRLLAQAPAIEGLGDFDGLIGRLQGIDGDITAELATRRAVKDRLAARAEALADSADWKATGDELRALFEEWKTVGTLGREVEQAVWERFNRARQTFYGRREAHFTERDRERAESLAKKEDLCTRAEAMRDSTDWRGTGNALKALQVEWKAVGSAGREQDQALWARFRGAMDVFFANRTARFDDNRRAKESLCAAAEAVADSDDWMATSSTLKGLQEQWKQAGFAGGEHDDALWTRFRTALDAFYNRRSEIYADRDRSYAENLRQKDALADEAESLLLVADLRAAIGRAKAMQEEWKAIGPAPRERADEVWKRFRAACDDVFARSREQWELRQTAQRTSLKDALERQRAFAREVMDSMARDDELLDRWQDQLATLRPGPRELEIRRDLESKIAGLQARLQGKQTHIEDLLASIAEMDARLATESRVEGRG